MSHLTCIIHVLFATMFFMFYFSGIVGRGVKLAWRTGSPLERIVLVTLFVTAYVNDRGEASLDDDNIIHGEQCIDDYSSEM